MGRLDLRFSDTKQGKKIFHVIEGGCVLFTGTEGECSRFLAIHAKKEEKEMAALARPRRRSPKSFRRYRYTIRGSRSRSRSDGLSTFRTTA